MAEDSNASDQAEMYNGYGLDYWERVFAPHIVEASATVFMFTTEAGEQIRIAFGNEGPFTSSDGQRAKPTFTHALTLPKNIAVGLAQELLRVLAEVKPNTAN